jgi:hypothetical protein
MPLLRWIVLGCLVPVLPVASAGEGTKPQALSVLYVGNAATPRGREYAAFLQKHFRKAAAAERNGFDPKQAAAFDVVLLDWSQGERPEKPMSPLGPREAWDKPTVLLGSAGLLLAEAWDIHGGIG